MGALSFTHFQTVIVTVASSVTPPLFHSRLKSRPTSFTNLSRHGLSSSSLMTDSTDFMRVYNNYNGVCLLC